MLRAEIAFVGVRFSETELELLALAEYVQELEAALERQKAISASSQSSDIAPGQRGIAQVV
jgi:hypothetical protein